MKTKIILLMILMLILLPSLQAKICEDVMTPGSANCTLLTPKLTCTMYNYTLYNNTGGYIYSANLTLINGSTSIYSFPFQPSTGGYIIEICDGSTREISVRGGESMYLAIAMIVMAFIAIFLFLASITEMFYAKMVFVIISLGFGILLYAIGMQISQEMGVTTISNLMNSGYPIVIYSTLIIIGLMMVYMIYNFFMTIIEARKNAKR